MNDQMLLDALRSVSLRYRRLIMAAASTGVLGTAALGGIALRQWLHGADTQAPLIAAGTAAAVCLAMTPVLAYWLQKTRDPLWLARRIEKQFPDLDTRLLAALEQPDKSKDAGYLQQMVITQAVAHARRNGWEQLVPNGRLRAFRLANWGMIAACVVVGGSIALELGKYVTGKKPAAVPPKAIAKEELKFEIKVDADKEVERGLPLLVTATFGNGKIPANVELVYREKGSTDQQQYMSKSLDDPKFVARISAVKNDLEFAVKYDKEQTEWYQVSVFDYPALKQADAHLKYPDFTSLPEKDIPNTRLVTAVEGTQATLTFRLNKAVTDAQLMPTARQQGRGGAAGRGPANGAGAPGDVGAGPQAADAGAAGNPGGRGGLNRVNALAAQNGRGAANDIVPDAVGQPPVKLVQDAKDPTVYTVQMDLLHSQFYQLQLTDADKRNNRDRASMTINVTQDRPATVRVITPGRDVEVSPLEELMIRAQVTDDFGVKRAGITYTMHGETRDIVIGENIPGSQATTQPGAGAFGFGRAGGAGAGRGGVAAAGGGRGGNQAQPQGNVAQILSMEDLHAQPDELLSYNLWAEDVGPDGKVRRTLSDMYFAEVRPFEEIYTQGQQPAGGQGAQQQQQQGQNGQQQQAAQRAEDVTNQLKQILAAMWTVVRREVAEKPTDDFVPDVQAITEAQQNAHDSADGLTDRITDDRARAYLEDGLKQMDKVTTVLKGAQAGPTAKPLPDAITADQAAYDDFLKLRDRQFEVVRGNRQSQQGNTAQQRRQQQLNQLDLANQQNRYQNQRQAQQQQDQQDQQQRQAQQEENRQVLNRLRDLAQRQQDLNQQMRETQAALQAAQNQQQRDEAQRQLARLQEEQQQQVQDTDDLRDRLNEPQNQDSQQDTRQQLDQTRDNVQRAAQALQQGQVGDAAAAGQRASEQLAQLQDQVRQQEAGQFTDTMRQMRQDARQLNQESQDTSQQLTQLDQQMRDQGQQPGAGLRDTQRQQEEQQRQQISDNLAQQQQQLDRLMNNMQQTVTDAESTEPLLSRQLYDTIRQAQQTPTDKALDDTKQLVRDGLTQEARKSNSDAQQGIDRLRQGVEQAASSVIGDDSEALRRARDELDNLQNQLDREIGRNQQAQQDQQQANGRGGRGQQQDQQANGRGGQQDPQANGRGGRGQDGRGSQGQADQQLAQAGQGDDANGLQQANAGRGGNRGNRGGAGGQQPDGAQPGDQQDGQGGDQQVADGQQPNGRGGAGRGGNPGNRGGAGGQQPDGAQPGDQQDGQADQQVADGQQPNGRGGAGRGGNRGNRGGAGGQQPDGAQPGDQQDGQGDQQVADGQQPNGRGGAGRGGNRGNRGNRGGAGGQQPGGAQPGDQQDGQGGDQQVADGQQPNGRGGAGRGGNRGNRGGGAGGRGGQNPGDAQTADAQNPNDPNPDGQNPGDQNGNGANGQNPLLAGGGGLRGNLPPGVTPAGGGDANPDQQGPQLAGAGGGGGGFDLPPDQADPITGGGYRNFTDRLRDIQDMVDNPQLQAQAQQIRQRVGAVRNDYVRNAAPPNWNIVQQTISKPLAELRQKVSEELLQREKAQAALVPLDKEAIPPEYQDQVKQYYEKLGSGK